MCSCTNNEDATSSLKNDSTQTSTVYTADSLNSTSASETVYEPIVLPYANTIEHYFSNDTLKDIFKFTITGESVLNGTVCFTIISPKSDTLYLISLSAYSLLEYFKEETKDTIEWEKYIVSCIDSFFDEHNFTTSASSKYSSFEFDAMYACCNKKEWEEIQSNQTSIIFKYNIGGGSITAITYSKKQKKAICYYAYDI